jgi:hypothetical protein
MILGALLDAGVDRELLLRSIASIGLSGYKIDSRRVDRAGISSTHVEVSVPEEGSHRHLHHIRRIIEDSGLSLSVKERAVAIFTRLAEAEARVHGIDVEKVHFHEVGAMDAIIDVVGACVGFEILGIERFICSKIHVGSGFVKMEHGKFPVPPPAVADLLQKVPIYSTGIDGEFITPTAAAIITTICDSYGALPEISIEQIGYGAGTRVYDGFPNVLRVMIGETVEAHLGPSLNGEELVLLETNIDDLSPQILGYVMGRAFEIGALDCWFTPIQMKKNRPATMLSVLCTPEQRPSLTEMIYSETSTLGVRVRRLDRESLDREVKQVSTEFGMISVKFAVYNGRIINVMPEHDDVARLARENKVPYRTVRDAAISAAGQVRAATTH